MQFKAKSVFSIQFKTKSVFFMQFKTTPVFICNLNQTCIFMQFFSKLVFFYFSGISCVWIFQTFRQENWQLNIIRKVCTFTDKITIIEILVIN